MIAKLDVLYYKYLCCVFIIFSPYKYYFWTSSFSKMAMLRLLKNFLRHTILQWFFTYYSPNKYLCSIWKKILTSMYFLLFILSVFTWQIFVLHLQKKFPYANAMQFPYSPYKCLCCISKFFSHSNVILYAFDLYVLFTWQMFVLHLQILYLQDPALAPVFST